MPENDKPPYPFSTHIGAACNKQMKTFHDLAQRLGMDMIDLMLQCNGREVAAVIRACSPPPPWPYRSSDTLLTQ